MTHVKRRAGVELTAEGLYYCEKQGVIGRGEEEGEKGRERGKPCTYKTEKQRIRIKDDRSLQDGQATSHFFLYLFTKRSYGRIVVNHTTFI